MLAAALRTASKLIDLRPAGPSAAADGDGSSGSGTWAAGEYLTVGCIYKEQPLKPSIIDEYSGARQYGCVFEV